MSVLDDPSSHGSSDLAMARPDGDLGRRVGRSLGVRYALALTMIAVLVLGTSIVLGGLITRQERHGHLIALAATQITLSQRIAAHAAEIEAPTDERGRAQAVAAIASARREMATALDILSSPVADPQLADVELRRLYAGPEPDVERTGGLERRVAQFLARTASLEQLASTRHGAGLARSIRLEALGPLRVELARALTLHEAASRREQQALQRAHVALTVATLLLLAAEVVLIFGPMVRRIRRLTTRLAREAATDPLTGLTNRREFTGQLGKLVASTDGKAATALLVIDLDWFGEVNEAEGHAAGDALLQSVAGRLRRLAPPVAAIGRLGGDEFGLATRAPTRAAAELLAERCRRLLQKPVRIGDRVLPVSVSIGLAIAPDHAIDAAELMAAADAAMTAGKRSARGSVTLAGPQDRKRIERDAALRASLEGLDDGLAGLDVLLQPQLRIDDGALVGFEALALWHHPTLGRLAPADFLPFAARHDRMPEIDTRTRRAAFAAMERLRAAGFDVPRIAVNLSAGEAMRADFAASIERAGEALGLPLSSIEIEITEEVLLDHVSPDARRRLAELRQRGVRLALDDFGTGHSSLAQLLRLPLDAIKLDRSFIAGLGRDRRAEAIVQASVALARRMGLEIVGEGVETQAQLEFLRTEGCDIAQGYFFGRPMPVDQAMHWLGQRAAAAVAPNLIRLPLGPR